MGPTILLLAPHPAFFERRDTWFNRRGVDVFCAMDADAAAAVFAMRRVGLLLCQGVPCGMPESELREVVPFGVPIVVLTEGGDDPDLLQTYLDSDGSSVLRAPFGDKVMHFTARALQVPTRHYLRILVQIQAATNGQGGTFGFSNNISATGMLLETKRQMEVGQTVALSFLLPGAPQMTAARALVVRQAESRDGTHRFGVKFIDLPAADREFLVTLRTQHDYSSPAVAAAAG